jgi:hypothetical protein
VKALALLLAGLALAGCAKPSQTVPPVPPETAQRIAVEHGALAVLRCYTNAIAGASNRAELEARFAVEADKVAVEYLSQYGPAALAGRIDAVKRGTTQSPYTLDQLQRARAAKLAK